MSTTEQKLSVAEASSRFLAREYPSLDQMILCRIEFAIGRLLEWRRDDIAAGDETVKTALCGARYNVTDYGEIFTPGEISALSHHISPGHTWNTSAIDIVRAKVSELVPVGSDLRNELDGLDLVFVSYQKYMHDRNDEYYLGIGKRR